MGTVRKVIAAVALAGLISALPLGASAEPQDSQGKPVQVATNGGQGDWPLAK